MVAVLLKTKQFKKLKSRRTLQRRLSPAPAVIQFKEMKFLITDRPTDINMNHYIEGVKKYDINTIVRVCEPSYCTAELLAHGIQVIDLPFADGSYPPPHIVSQWFDIINEKHQESPNSYIAVHCVAGLGRAPLLVALALLERGLKYEDTVEMIRKHRRGALNAKQLLFLSNYKPKAKLRIKANKRRGCVLQ